MNKTCLQCGTEFGKDPRKSWAAYNKQQYCSALCRNKGRMGTRKGEIVYCDNCGTEMYRRLSWIQEHNFCSHKCLGEWQHNHLSGEYSPLYGRERSSKERLNMGIGQKGNKNSTGPRPSIIGAGNPFWNKNHNEEIRGKMRELAKERWLNSEYVKKQIIWESELTKEDSLKEKILAFEGAKS